MRKQSLLKRLLSFTRPYLIYLVSALVLAIVSVSLTLYAPVLTGRAVDSVVGKGQVDFGTLKSVLTTLGYGRCGNIVQSVADGVVHKQNHLSDGARYSCQSL